MPRDSFDTSAKVSTLQPLAPFVRIALIMRLLFRDRVLPASRSYGQS